MLTGNLHLEWEIPSRSTGNDMRERIPKVAVLTLKDGVVHMGCPEQEAVKFYGSTGSRVLGGGSNAGPGKPGWGVSYVHFHSISHFPMNVSLTLARTHLNVYRRPRLRNHKLPGPATMFLYHHGPRVSVNVETNTCVDLSDVSG